MSGKICQIQVDHKKFLALIIGSILKNIKQQFDIMLHFLRANSNCSYASKKGVWKLDFYWRSHPSNRAVSRNSSISSVIIPINSLISGSRESSRQTCPTLRTNSGKSASRPFARGQIPFALVSISTRIISFVVKYGAKGKIRQLRGRSSRQQLPGHTIK